MRTRILMIPLTALLLLSVISPTLGESTDDQFGYNFSPNYMPLDSQGLSGSYAISVSGTSVNCSTGGGPWVLIAVNTVVVKGGTPHEAVLQDAVGLGCHNNLEQWEVFYYYWDTSGNTHSAVMKWLSLSSFSSLSGTLSIYYSGSPTNSWVFSVYVSQNGETYTYSPGQMGGTYVDGSNNDWTAVETLSNQADVTFSASFQWFVDNPQFYVGGYWQDWNYVASNYYWLYLYAVYKPTSQSTNLIGVQQIGSSGVEVYYYGPNPPSVDGHLWTWRLNPCCSVST